MATKSMRHGCSLPRSPSLRPLLRAFLLLAGASAIAVAPLRAQSPEWNATLLVQPYPSPFFADWERNPQTAVLTVLYSGTAPREYRVEATLRSRERGPFGRALSPLQSFGFGPSSQLMTAVDLLDWRILSVDSEQADVALRAGILPQGNYEVCTFVRDVQGGLLAEACADFAIALPEPPQLIVPMNGSALHSSQPVFQWTPVLVPPQLGLTYRLRVAERRPGQTPLVALESNLPHVDTEIAAVPMSVYPLEALPLEEGREYVWRIETLDGTGQPITVGQRHSEVWSFTYSGPSALPILGDPLPEPFELVPGLAAIVGTRMLSVKETERSYILSGAATLELSGTFGASLGIDVEELEIDKSSLPEARVLSGRVTGRISPDAIPEALRGRYVRFDEMEYTPETGLRLAASTELPNAPGVRLDGHVAVTAGGLVGVLTAEGNAGGIFTVGDDPVTLRVRSMQATYPGADLELAGALDVFGRDVGCDRVTARATPDGAVDALVACHPDVAIPLIHGVDRVQLRLRTLTGTVSIDDAAANGLVHSLTVAGDVALADGVTQCGAAFELGIEDGTVEPRTMRSLCDPADATLEFESLRLRLSALEFERLVYSRETGFDFAARMNVTVSASGMPHLQLPELTGVLLDRSGVSFPEIDVPITRPRMDVAGFGVRVTRVRLAPWTLAWNAWDQGADTDGAGGAGFRFGLDMDVTLPSLAAGAPSCLTAEPIRVTGAELAGGRISAAVAERAFSPACALPLGDGASFELHRLGGELAVRFAPDAELERTLDAHGALVLPSLFACADDAARRLSLDAALSFSPYGRLTGSATPQGGCPVSLGGVALALTNGRLDFGDAAGVQTAVLSATADASFTLSDQPVTGTGSIEVDLIEARLRGGRIDFRGPFAFDLPRDAPVLSFRIGAAQLDSAGFHIDGQQELRLPGDHTVAATFDDVTFELDEMAIADGRIVFGSSFALELGIPDDGELTWRAVAPAAPLGVTVGARFDLPAEIILDSNGFAARGGGGAVLVYQQRSFQDLELRASDDFMLSVDPFAVRSGVVELEHDGVGVAYVDALGFHPNFAYFGTALLPDRLGLPGEDVAYLELRDDTGELRVDAVATADGVTITTRPGMAAPMVFPALQLGAPDAPRVDATFSLTLDAGARRVTAGALGVVVPPDQRALFDLWRGGIPFAIDSIAFDANAGARIDLAGHLTLFGAAQGGAGEVRLALDGNGTLAGRFDVATAAAPIPLHAASDALTLGITRVAGTFDADMSAGELRYDVDLDAALALDLGAGRSYSADARLAVTERGLTVRELVVPEVAGAQTLDIGVARLQLSNLRVPLLSWERGTNAWDFELLFDAALQFTDLNALTLPVLRDISLRPAGMSLPSFHVPQLTGEPVAVAGFRVRPLAFRMGALHVDWFNSVPVSDVSFAFDLELGFGENAPASLGSMRLTILNAGYANGRFTGAIEPRVLPEALVVPLGGERMALHVARLGGALSEADGTQHIAITAAGSFHVPASLQCGGEENWLVELPPEATLTLTSTGRASGTATGVVPTCPLELGPLSLRIAASTLRFDVGAGVDAADDAQRVELDLDGSLRLPGPVAGDTIEAGGSIGVDLVSGSVLRGAIAIDSPFRWNLPAEDPLLRFVVQRGRLDEAGLHLTGTGALDLFEYTVDTIGGVEAGAIADASVSVAFNDLTISLADFSVIGGSATIEHSFALDVGLERENRPRYRARRADEPRDDGDGPGFRVVLPENVTFEQSGLRIDGTGTAELAYGDTTYGPLRIDFTSGFAIAHEPAVGVAAGRANFILNDSEIAYLDASGFWPGDLFGILPLPARLGLPTEAVAYLELRDGNGAMHVETQTGVGGMAVRTRPGESLPLRIPALAQGADIPTVLVELDVVVNPTTHQLVSGFVRATTPDDSPALFTLADLGLPLEVRTLAYEDAGSGYVFRLDARLPLPPSLGGLVLAFDDVLIGEDGIDGSAVVGTWSELYDPDATPILTEEIAADVSLDLYGARATFGTSAGAGELRIAGAVRSGIFADPVLGPALFFFTAAHGVNGFEFTVEPHNVPNGMLAIGPATFEPVAIGEHGPIEVTATNEELSVRLGGVLRVPPLSETFAVTIDGLEIGTGGIRFPQVSIAGSPDAQSVELFGVQFTLQDSLDAGGALVHAALAFAYADEVLHLTLAGQLDFLGNITRFHGLRVGTDGTVALESASLLSEPLVLAADLLTVDALTIKDRRLRADLAVTLPAPFTTDGPQHAHFTIAPDGSIEGGTALTLLSEARGLGDEGGEIRTQLPLGIATLHPYHVGLALDFDDLERSAVELVADLYVAGESGNRITLGEVSGGTVAPGLRIGFDGTRQWGHFGLEREFDFDFDAVVLEVTNISAPESAEGFAVEFGGRLSLNLASVTGAVEFTGFRITDQGRVTFEPDGIQGGEFSIAGVVNLEVNGFSYSDTPTVIEVAGGGMPTADEQATTSIESVQVQSYIRFGGRIDVVDVFAGGVEEFLLYRTAEAGSQMIVRRASLSVYDVVDMNADFRYRETADGFEMVLGAAGKLMKQYDVMLVGAIESGGGISRAGVFLAAGVQIPIPPAIMVTQLGGGFFYNPKPEYLDLVRQYANVGGSADAKIRAETGRFAVLLYGGASIIDRALIEGRVLLTVMPTALQIDGTMQVLSQGNRFHGDAHLVVGLEKAYAEGNMSFNVDYSPILGGAGAMEFFVYGPDAWGIMGNTNVRYMLTLDGASQLFIGPPGFIVSSEISQDFDIWILKVRGDFGATAWYRRAASEWGAYAKIGVSASVLGGAATARGNLHGALILSGTPVLYAAGRLKGCAAGQCKRFSAWASFRDGDIRGGEGSNSAMADALDEAQAIAEEMADAQAEAEDALADAQVQGDLVVMSAEELAAAYDVMQRWGTSDFQTARSYALGMEASYAPDPNDGAYFDWYMSMLLQQGAPRIDDGLVRQYSDSVAARVADLEVRRGAVLAAVDRIHLQVSALEELTESADTTSPVRAASFAMPVTRTITDADGREAKVIESGPGFDVDGAAAARAVEDLTELQSASDAAAERTRVVIGALENGLTSIRAATLAGGSASLLDYNRQLAVTRGAAVRPFALEADMILRRQDWMRAQLAAMGSPEPSPFRVAVGGQTRFDAIESIVERKTRALQNEPSRIYSMARSRLALLDAWAAGRPAPASPLLALATSISLQEANATIGSTLTSSVGSLSPSVTAMINMMSTGQSLVQQFVNTASSYEADTAQYRAYVSAEANAAGMLVWYYLARAGMTAADERASSATTMLRAAYDERLSQLDQALEEISASTHRLFAGQAALTGVLHDIYDIQLESAADPVQAATLRARRDSLRTELTVPRVGDVLVTSTTSGYFATQTLQWSGSHPTGAYEYLFRDIAAGDPEGTLLSAGRSGSLTTWHFTTTRDATPLNRSIYAGARGGAGFVGLGRADYTLAWQPGAVAATTTATTSAVSDATPPTTPVVGFTGVPLTRDADGADVAWTLAGDEFDAHWSAYDAESGIGLFEYAIGSTPGGTELRDWTDAGGRTSVRVQGITIAAAAPLYVSVRARNGADLLSAVGISPPLRRDVTPPAFPVDAALSLVSAPAGVGSDAPVFLWTSCAIPLPAAIGTPQSVTWGTRTGGAGQTQAVAVAPRRSVELPQALDDESGIDRYLWRIDEAPLTELTDAGWTEHAPHLAQITVEGAPLDYEREFYITVFARNRAALASPPLVLGPFRVADPTAPAQPAFCTGARGGELSLHVTRAAQDPETSVAAHEYRILDGENVVRDWTALEGELQATITLPGFGPVPGAVYHVELRGVNGQAQRGRVARSGPVFYDTTPPAVPAVSASASSARVLSLTVNAPADPESGLYVQQQMAVRNPGKSTGYLVEWRTVPGAQAGAYSTSLQLPSTAQVDTTYTLMLRTINRAGMPSAVVYRDFVIPRPPLQPVTRTIRW